MLTLLIQPVYADQAEFPHLIEQFNLPLPVSEEGFVHA